MAVFLLTPLLLTLFPDVSAPAVSPRTVWQHEVVSNVYAPPLAADITPHPGKEIVIADSEARRLRCIGADGAQLWECDGGWKKRLISAPALSDPDESGSRLLAVGNGDGSVVCVDAASGAVMWRREIGPIEWGGVVWANLDGSGFRTLVAGTQDAGIHALNAAGETLWVLPADALTPPLRLRGSLAACDIDGDGRDEIFGVTRFGVFCVGPDGVLRWERQTGDDFPGAPIVVDASGEGRPRVFAASSDDAALWCFDAATGRPEWRAPLAGNVDITTASALAAGDLNGDGLVEILLGDREGRVYAFDAFGQPAWVFQTRQSLPVMPIVADVTGNGFPEVLAASGDHHLYCLDGAGRLLWKYKAGTRLLGPPTVVNLENDGTQDILLGGSDRLLRRITLDRRAAVGVIAWPSRRWDTAQRGAPPAGSIPAPTRVSRKEILFHHGGFEQGKVRNGLEQFDPDSPFYAEIMMRPRGWRPESLEGSAVLCDDRVHSGSRALALAPQASVCSYPIPSPLSLRRVYVEAWLSGVEGDAALVWMGEHGVIRETGLTLDEVAAAGDVNEGTTDAGASWRRYSVEAEPPLGARCAVVVLRAGTEPVRWDAVSVEGLIEEPAALQVLVNQAGYDTGAPKRFVVQANFLADAAAFSLVDASGAVLYESTLEHAGRIRGYFGNDWGYEYYTGDFSDLNAAGEYRIRAQLDGLTGHSLPFEIGPDLIWSKAAEPAFRFFYYQRCGMAIPGYHEACHLDDAVGPDGTGQRELWGGWHDAGDYNKYHNAPYVYGMTVAYAAQKQDFDRLGTPVHGFSALFDEILWGGDHVRRMVLEDGAVFGHIFSGYGFWGPPELETDNLPGTGDERRGKTLRSETPDDHHAALARIAALLEGRDAAGVPFQAWVDAARRSQMFSLSRGRRGWPQADTALHLYKATGDDSWAAQAKELMEELFRDAADAERLTTPLTMDICRRVDAAFGTDYAQRLAPAFVQHAEQMLLLADNPFGVYTFGPAERPNFFNTPADAGGWHVGTNSRLLEAAAHAALAYAVRPDPRLLRFAYDQFNWVLGMNPYNISLMEGVGDAFAPTYHHRYAFSGVSRGAVPGGVVNGITRRDVGDDRPAFDMSGADIPAYESNEVWLPHNTAMLNALARLKEARRRDP